MAYIAPIGQSSLPKAGDTVEVRLSGTEDLAAGLLQLDRATPQDNPIIVPDSDQWGFEQADHALLDIWWVEGNKFIPAQVIVNDRGLPGADSTVPGPTGDDGATAYELAVVGGFVGTEAAWLLSLKGEPGEAGSDADVTGHEATYDHTQLDLVAQIKALPGLGWFFVSDTTPTEEEINLITSTLNISRSHIIMVEVVEANQIQALSGVSDSVGDIATLQRLLGIMQPLEGVSDTLGAIAHLQEVGVNTIEPLQGVSDSVGDIAQLTLVLGVMQPLQGVSDTIGSIAQLLNKTVYVMDPLEGVSDTVGDIATLQEVGAAPSQEDLSTFEAGTDGWTYDDGGGNTPKVGGRSTYAPAVYAGTYGMILAGSYDDDEEAGPWYSGFISRTLDVVTGDMTIYAEADGELPRSLKIYRNGVLIDTKTLTLSYAQYTVALTGGVGVTVKLESSYADDGGCFVDNIAIGVPV